MTAVTSTIRAAGAAMTRAAAFLALALVRPRTIGAVLPSSRHLAGAMARAAAGAQRLVELGAGTGAITEALHAQHRNVPTLVVEMEHGLAEHLRRRFPRFEVRAAAAHQVLPSLRRTDRTAIVSSLPFRSLPARLRLCSSRAIERFLIGHPQCRLVQFTYLPREPFELRLDSPLRWRHVATVWRNVPPARVWELRADPC